MTKTEQIEKKHTEENLKNEHTKKIVINLKGTKEMDDFFLTVLSIYEIPMNGILKEDSSYYCEGHYLTSSKSDLNKITKSDIDLKEFKRHWTSSIRLVNPCGGISSEQLQFLNVTMFEKGEKTIRFLLPECNDYTNNIFISWKNGVMTEKFSADTWIDKEVNFIKMNDTIFYTLIDDRDELVSAFQSDYRYEYNNRTNKLLFIKPHKQRIDWESEAIVDLIAYKTMNAASEKDNSKVKFIIKTGERFYLDTLYREFNSLYILKGDSTGYLNTDNLNYETISCNGAG